MGAIVERKPHATEADRFAVDRHPSAPGAIDRDCLALRCLRAVIAATGLPEKVFAVDVSPQQFNKLLNGGQAFGLDRLDRLPPDLRDEYLIRYGTECGLIVRRPTREEDLERQREQLVKVTRAVLEWLPAEVRARVLRPGV